MKIYKTYGLIGAALTALLVLTQFFAGMHGERVYLLNNWKIMTPLMLVGWAIEIGVIVLGLRAWRDVAPGKTMSFGRGFSGGVLIGLFQGIGALVFWIVYGFGINPGFKDAMMSNIRAQMTEEVGPGLSNSVFQGTMDVLLNPVVLGLQDALKTVLLAVIISLVAAALLKRAESGFAKGLPAPPAL